MTTTHEVTKYDGMVRVVTKVDGAVSVSHVYTTLDWTDSVAPVVGRMKRDVVRHGDTLTITYTEDEDG